MDGKRTDHGIYVREILAYVLQRRLFMIATQ